MCVRRWMNLDSLWLGIRYSYKVMEMCHVPDLLLHLMTGQNRPRTSHLPPD